MAINKEKNLKNTIIEVGKKLYDLRLVVARSGNLSARIDDENVFVTATGTSLGSLGYGDIIKVNFKSPDEKEKLRLTTEFPLHSLIYKNFPVKIVIHCHPTLINAYFAVYAEIKALTFETKLNLGNIPVIHQDSPAVTNPEAVIEALKLSNIVVLKNHGVVSIGENFTDALYLIETLEEAVKTAAVARIFKKEICDGLDKEIKETLASVNAYKMFSKEHILAIVDLINQDEFFLKKASELDLTMQLAIKLDEEGRSFKFNFQNGKIGALEFDEDAPFVISAPANVWESVFLGKLEPFVATMQGKMKLKGQIAQLSRWYVPFSRLFELFKEVKILEL